MFREGSAAAAPPGSSAAAAVGDAAPAGDAAAEGLREGSAVAAAGDAAAKGRRDSYRGPWLRPWAFTEEWVEARGMTYDEIIESLDFEPQQEQPGGAAAGDDAAEGKREGSAVAPARDVDAEGRREGSATADAGDTAQDSRQAAAAAGDDAAKGKPGAYLRIRKLESAEVNLLGQR